MRRIRLTTRPPVLFAAMLAVALIALLPMRLVLGWIGLDAQGLVAQRVTGSVWGATLTDARVGEIALGDLNARVAPLSLLVGQARIALSRTTGAQPLVGAVALSRHGFAVDDVTASLATGRLFAPVPVTMLALDGVSVRFRDGQCLAADGRVRATLDGAAGGVALPPLVSGTIRCDGTALLLPLVSLAGTDSVSLRIEASGSYRADLSLRPGDPVLGGKLQALGFVRGPTGAYAISTQGNF